MGIKTEDFAKNIPPKELTEGVDWMGILDSFDSTVLDERYINECARRYLYIRVTDLTRTALHLSRLKKE